MTTLGLLRAHGIAPKKQLGQNFLVEPSISRKIADAVAPCSTVLEIGPGLGALTEPLLQRATRVIAIERDRELAHILTTEVIRDVPREQFELIVGDALDQDWGALLQTGPEPRALAGNLPYSITGALIERAIGLAPLLTRAVFMVQLEVADRLASKPSTKEYGALTVFARAAFRIERLVVVRAHLFHPQPKVDSAVVVLTPRPDRIPETPIFRALVKGGFQARRKTLRNAWKSVTVEGGFERIASVARDAGIDLERRAETLSPDDFGRVATALE